MCKICKNPTVGWLLWLLVFLFGIQTTVWSQNEKTELNVKDVTVREFFNKIEAQSEYRFTYRDLSVDELQRISYSGRVEPIEALLQEVLTPLNLQFKISRKNVLITRKAASPQQKDAQAKKYSGIVKDNRGEPLIGASVRVKGLTVGTITDVNGAFSIEAAPGSTLEVSYIGYLPVEVMVTERDYISVTLSEDAKMLEEVVVVGYGMQKKENLTGAVSAVDVQKTLEGRAIPDAARGLQGTTPGLTILVPSGEIGSDPIIKIRGQLGSINGGNSPLILLDNVEIPNLSFVNSDDIESISVLKDAASASIYGAKGAFGVVLITTKKGAKTDGAHISYNGTYSWQNAEKYEMGGYEAMEFSWLAIQNTSPGSVKTGAFYMVSEDQLKKAKEWQEQYGGKLGPNDPTIYGRDWEWDGTSKYGYRTYDPYEYLISKNAPAQDHKISITGKAGNTTYAVGLNYLDQTGMNKVAKSDRFVRYSGTVKVTSEINKYLTVNAGAMYSTRQKEWPFTTFGAIDQWYYLYRWGPQYPLGQAPNKNGDLIDVRSPYSEFKQANTGYTRNNYTSFNVGALVNFTDNWTFNFDYAHANTEFRQWWPGTQFTALNSWGAPVQGDDGNWYLDESMYTGAGSAPDYDAMLTGNGRRNTINAYTTYNLKLGEDHAFKLMAGLNRVTYDYTSVFAEADEVTNLENPQFNFTSGEQFASGDFSWEAQLGYFGRINYAFRDKYLLEANLRYDGSSKFTKALWWRWYPSFSAGWRVSEEAFMETAKPVLSSLKLRGSYGTIGDQTIASSYYIAKITPGTIGWYVNGQMLNYTGQPSAIASDITWQDIVTTDFGVDVSFLNNAIGFTFDWYIRDTKNMIVPNESTTTTYGTAAPMGNYGNLRTKGWELSIDLNHRFANGLGINGMFTLSDAVTKVTKYGTLTGIDSWYNGKTYGEIWGYRTDRLYQKDDFEYDASGNLVSIVLDASHGDKNAGRTTYQLKDGSVYQAYLEGGSFKFMPGDVKYKDLNGDGQITDGARTIDDHGDLEVIGNIVPRYEYGFRLGADYKGFDFSAFFQGIGKRNLWGSSSLTLAGFNTSDGAIAKALCTDYWTENNTDAFYPRPWNLANSTDLYSMKVQDRYLLDMSYLRLKNITLGYTIPASLTRKALINKVRIYATAENLFTWDHLNGLPLNPENSSDSRLGQYYSPINSSVSSSVYQGGRVGLGTPAFHNVSVGVQLNF